MSAALFYSIKGNRRGGHSLAGAGHVGSNRLTPLVVMLSSFMESYGIGIGKDFDQNELGRIVVILQDIEADIACFLAGVLVVVNGDLLEVLDMLGLYINKNKGLDHGIILRIYSGSTTSQASIQVMPE